jgi:hypothetical protein
MANVKVSRSPVNVLIGKLLEHLRLEAGLTEEGTANALGVKRSYLRVIELGNRCLPAYASSGLHELGLDFLSASALTSAVQYLDQRETKADYDLERILVRIGSLTRAVPHLEPVLVWMTSAVLNEQAGDEIEKSLLKKPSLDHITKVLKTGPVAAKQLNKESEPNRLSLKNNLSPIFDDIVQGLVSQLSLFPPHTNADSFADWEKLNYRRFTGVAGYIRRPEEILEEDDKFDWAFLANEHKPVVTMYVPSTTLRIDRIQSKFRKLLTDRLGKRKGAADGIENVVFKSIPADLQQDCERLLWFDFASRGEVRFTKDELLELVKEDIGRGGDIRRFHSAWIYRLRPSVLRPEAAPHSIGVMGASPLHPAGAYVVALASGHMNEWIEIFARAEQSHAR